MKQCFTKAVSLLLALLMIVSCVPATVLAEVAQAVVASDETATRAASKGPVADGEPYDPDNPFKDSQGNAIVHNGYSPYEPYATEDDSHPFLPGGSAWMDLSKIYYGAPATPNTPITDWSANTSVYNITGTGNVYGSGNGVVTGTEIHAIDDMNLIDEYLWAGDYAAVGGHNENGIIQSGVKKHEVKVDFYKKADEASVDGESLFYNMTTGKKMQNLVWIDQVGSNGTKDGSVDCGNEIFDRNGNVVPSTWMGEKTLGDGTKIYCYQYSKTYYDVERQAPAADDTNPANAFVYNRYDAMQGKWGLTLDKNVSSVMWNPTWAGNYYGTGKAMNNSELYLSDTPYLFYSTEAPDGTKMAISLLIGTPVQSERKETDSGKTTVKPSVYGNYEFRWYTITDNSDRPGIANDTRDNSMVPMVTVSDVVYSHYPLSSSSSELIALMLADPDSMDPLKVAQAEGKNPETMYVDGAITGCIDFTQILPMLMSMYDSDDKYHGRADVKYKIAQIRVDVMDSADTDSAARINYMYFGPGQAAVYTPQSAVGNDVNGANWMYAQYDDQVGDQDPNYVAKNRQNVTTGSVNAGDVISGYYIGDSGFDFDCGYTNGWDNGLAVSIKNTPNTPQLMTIDTYGQGGQLITYEEYYNERLAYYQSIDGTADDPDGVEDDRIGGKGIYQLAEFTRCSVDEYDKSRVWKYTDVNGKVQYLETEHNKYDDIQYIMVTVPIRKWVNVLGDSRKLTFNINVERYGVEGVDPTFCMWGNAIGSLGPGHGDIKTGNRFSAEDMLAVFGDGYYQVDCSYNYKAAEIDKTLGHSTFFDGTDSWFDILNSPYVYGLTITDQTVAANGTRLGYGSEMIGYTFVTAIRFAVPAGTKFTVQGMKGDGNSAGLNMYSTTGSIVSAFDGGTGVQPEIIVSNSLSEKKVSSVQNADSSYTYTESANGTINGTQSSGAAAYGPMLEQSFYTIYDMLDTERLNAAGNSSHAKGKQGQDQQHVYGQMWVSNSGQLEIRSLPRQDYCTLMGYTYGPQAEFPIYATITFTDTGEIYGVTGVLFEKWGAHFGYVRLRGTSTQYATAKAGRLYKEYTYANRDALYAAFNAADGDAFMANFRNQFLSELRNEWTLSNFVSQFTNFNGSDDADITSHAGKNPVARDIYAHNFGGVQLMYGNVWGQSSYGSTNTFEGLKDTTVRAVNTTDMEIKFTRDPSTEGQLSLAMTRVFDQPIMLHTNTVHQSFPVFYFDFTAPAGSGTNLAIALSMRVNGEDRLYYLDGSDGCLKTSYKDNLGGNMYGYFSFEDIIKATQSGTNTIYGSSYVNYGRVEVVGISIYVRRGSSYQGASSVTIRRLEIWQEETDWLDSIIADNQHMSGLGDQQSTAMNCQVKDSMNIISDAFFYGHDERNDGNITVTRVNDSNGNGVLESSSAGINGSIGGYKFDHTDNTTNETVMLPQSQFANMASEQFEVTRTQSYRKTNSNKGWAARIQSDTNADGVIDGEDDRYFSYDFDSAVETTKQDLAGNDLYEYRSSLGHLRVWVPSGQMASVVFESDRSFNTKNYKYLYYSYSMRDVKNGVSAEDKSADGKGSGISVAIKGQQNTSDRAYLEADGTWIYYPDGTPYWADQNREDRRQFNTTMNAALDLSTTDLESINQLVFYLRNDEAETAEFYINYIYLSNVPPTELITNELEQVQTQYYYLMDNTGDRYSARFPTIDNPTGQVSGKNNDNDRVNPVKVVRGEYLSTGTYFNGDRLYGYGALPSGTSNRVYDENTASDGYYEKLYGTTEADANAANNGSMKNIMFYAGESSDLNDITDYYQYKDRDGNGVGEIYDMLWSYGRWYDGAGESGLNRMYVSDGTTAGETKDIISGNLTRRYATENYVLLRSGIEPKKFLTYYDAMGGQMIYEGSAEDHKDGVIQFINSYYTTETVILSYFTWPTHQTKNEVVEPQKYGFEFDSWQGAFEDTTPTNVKELHRYNKKPLAKPDYFYAKWLKKGYVVESQGNYTYTWTVGDVTYTWVDLDKGGTFTAKDTLTASDGSTATPTEWTLEERANGDVVAVHSGLKHSAQFMKPDGDTDTSNDEVWVTREGNYDNEFAIILPGVNQIKVNGTRKHIVGWTVRGGDGTVYANSARVVIEDDVVFDPVFDGDAGSANMTVDIKISDNAELWLVRQTTVDKLGTAGFDITDGTGKVNTDYLVSVKTQNIPVTPGDNGEMIYTIQRNMVCIVLPKDNNPLANYVWSIPYDNEQVPAQYIKGSGGAIASTNNMYYQFSAFTDMTVNYAENAGSISYSAVYTAPMSFTEARTMTFYSQYDEAAIKAKGGTVVAAGTLYTRNGGATNNYDALVAMQGGLDVNMRLDESTINATSIKNPAYNNKSTYAAKSTYVRYVQSGSVNKSGQFAYMAEENRGLGVTYYMRGYVIYTVQEGGKTVYKVDYSDVVSSASVPAQS